MCTRCVPVVDFAIMEWDQKRLQPPKYGTCSVVPPTGFEPALPPPEGGALSPELRGPCAQRRVAPGRADPSQPSSQPAFDRAPSTAALVIARPLCDAMILDLLPPEGDKSKITTEVAGQIGSRPVMILALLSPHGYKSKITLGEEQQTGYAKRC